MDNEVLKNAMITNDPFEDLGSIKEFCEKFGGVVEIRIENPYQYNLLLIVKTREEVEMRLLCSNELSKIISESKSLSEEFLDYRILRVRESDGKKYIRVSKNINIKGDPNVDIMTQIELTKNIKGNKHIVYQASDLKTEPYVPKKHRPDDLIAW